MLAIVPLLHLLGCVARECACADVDPETGSSDTGGSTDSTDSDSTESETGPDSDSAADTGGDPAEGVPLAAYFPPASCDITVCGAEADATTIQGGLDQAAAGDTVCVCPGTWAECLVVANDVVLVSTDGPAETVLEPAAPCTVLLTEGADVELAGFTVTGAGHVAYSTGGALTLRSLYVLDNPDTTVMVSAFFNDLTVLDSWFDGNTANVALDIEEAANLTLDGNVFSESRGGVVGVPVYSQAWPLDARLTNNRFLASSANHQVMLSGELTAYNNVFVVPTGMGGIDLAGTFDLRDNLFLGAGSGYAVNDPSGSEFELEYNIFWDLQYLYCSDGCATDLDQLGRPSNLDADPLVDTWGTVAPTSPAIDAGDPDPAFNDPDGTRNDIGADGGPARYSL